MVEHRLRFVGYHVGWMAASVLVLAALGSFSYVLFYVVALIGYFVVYELVVPATVRPRWTRRVRLVGVCWLVGFLALAAWQVGEIVSSVA